MLVFGCDDKQIQEHIYSTVQKPTMATVFPIMQQMEKARLEVRQLASGSGNSAAPFARQNSYRDQLDRRNPKKNATSSRARSLRASNDPPAKSQQQQQKPQSTRQNCSGCSKAGHKYRSEDCPAKDAECNGCGKVRHFTNEYVTIQPVGEAYALQTTSLQ